MEKKEWPTEQKLSQLRQQGLVPYSKLATYCVASAALFFGILLVESDILEFVDRYKEFIKQDLSLVTSLAAWEKLKLLGTPLLQVVLLPVLCAGIAALLCGFMQTKFLFRFSALNLDLGRLNPFSKNYSLLALAVSLRELGLSVLFLFLVCTMLWFVLPSLFTILNNDQAFLWVKLSSLMHLLLPILVISLFIFAFFCWLVSRIRFMFKHRMTEQEVLQEQEELSL